MYANNLKQAFEQKANLERAESQKAYMRDQFEFFGVTAPERKEAQKIFFSKDGLPAQSDYQEEVKRLWSFPQRELQYAGQELTQKFCRHFEEDDIGFLEYLITEKPWWDTVDYIASNLVGKYFIKYPGMKNGCVEKWLNSNNLWLIRTALLFQLKYKTETDPDLLKKVILSQLGSKEFFINKAIGWSLRTYGKINEDWVVRFVRENELEPLSKKEALKVIRK